MNKKVPEITESVQDLKSCYVNEKRSMKSNASPLE